ncbi:hypothetical protein FSP39_001839 [Pinctada imbricata]|uniref:G-protein coupled receptors family 1 profile domain-containing protein n=1 Tax=Pinctada imbricata TaxID=66713 RepID=A0AA89C4U1_PINIB|nr:hypothetical protein FSP39_001839 [Pinctada imbricata]
MRKSENVETIRKTIVSLRDMTVSNTTASALLDPNNSFSVLFTTSTPEPSRLIWTPDVIQRVASIVCIMVLSFIGNVTIISILSCSRYRKQSRVNIFIINLAIGDLAVCFVTMTTEILFVVFGEWVLGAAACKLLPYVQTVTLASTTFILTSMAYDRFDAICQPLKFRSSVDRTKKMVAFSWVLSFLFAIPQMFIFVQTEEEVFSDGRIRYGCRSKGYTAAWQRKFYITFMALYILILPAILISYFYINVALVVSQQWRIISQDQSGLLRKSFSNTSSILKAKIKTIKMTLSIIALFIACWTPYFITTLIKVYSDYKYPIPAPIMVFTETVALIQSALNPILYGCFNFPLKRTLLETCCPRRYSLDSIQMNERKPNDSVTFTGDMKYSATCDSKTIVQDLSSVDNSVQSNNVHSNGIHNNNAQENRNEKLKVHGGSRKGKGRCSFITEANKHGFKLRVRFSKRESMYLKGNHSFSSSRTIQSSESSFDSPSH